MIAYVAGLSALHLKPVAVVQLSGSERRLERIIKMIKGCQFSVHDLSRVEVDLRAPATPRFNMPFELGMAVALADVNSKSHRWRVFESKQHRLTKSLSDLNGTDPHIHRGQVWGVLRALANAFVDEARPDFKRMRAIYRSLSRTAKALRRQYGSLFEARPFNELVVSARALADTGK